MAQVLLLVQFLFVCKLLVISHQLGQANAAQVIVAPETVVALVDPNSTANFYCEVEGVALDWYFNGTHHEENLEGVTSNITLHVHVNASESGALPVSSSHLWVARAEEFDNMSIVCRARGGNASESQDSDVAWLKLEAPLVVPYNLQLNATQTTISVLWNCAVAEHTDILYNITVFKMDGDTMVIQTQEAELSFELDHPFAELCTNYTFSVVAWSVLDTSDPSEPVTAGFQCPMPTDSSSHHSTTATHIASTTTATVSDRSNNEENPPENLNIYIYIIAGITVVVFGIAILIVLALLYHQKRNFKLKRDIHSDVQMSFGGPDLRQNSLQLEDYHSQEPVYDVTSHVANKVSVPGAVLDLNDPNYQTLDLAAWARSGSEENSSKRAPPGTPGLVYAEVCVGRRAWTEGQGQQHASSCAGTGQDQAIPLAPPPADDPVHYATVM